MYRYICYTEKWHSAIHFRDRSKQSPTIEHHFGHRGYYELDCISVIRKFILPHSRGLRRKSMVPRPNTQWCEHGYRLSRPFPQRHRHGHSLHRHWCWCRRRIRRSPYRHSPRFRLLYLPTPTIGRPRHEPIQLEVYIHPAVLHVGRGAATV